MNWVRRISKCLLVAVLVTMAVGVFVPWVEYHLWLPVIVGLMLSGFGLMVSVATGHAVTVTPPSTAGVPNQEIFDKLNTPKRLEPDPLNDWLRGCPTPSRHYQLIEPSVGDNLSRLRLDAIAEEKRNNGGEPYDNSAFTRLVDGIDRMLKLNEKIILQHRNRKPEEKSDV